MSISTCLDKFFTDLYTSYCFSEEQINKIKCKLNCSLTAYGAATIGTTGFIQIIQESYQCLREVIVDASSITYTQVGIALFGTLIITAIFVALIAIILLILGVQQNYGVTIFLILLMVFIYLISVFILIHNSNLTISTQINQAEADLTNCITAFNNAFNVFSNTQAQAICAGLNSYDSCFLCNILPFECPTGGVGTLGISEVQKEIKGDFESRANYGNSKFVSKEYGIIER
jgi:hypothetical protein